MKTRKVKGFTLIELIVVIAIFSIILVGATSMLQPVYRTMVMTDVQEDGSAAVSSFTKLLETELSVAEYSRAYCEAGAFSDSEREAAVEDFAKVYYGGVLKANSTASAPAYASGRFQVLQIDNTDNGKVSKWVYEVANLNESAISATQTDYQEYVINKAYYDTYSFEIKPGSYSTVEEFDQYTYAGDGSGNYKIDLDDNFTSINTAFTLKATTHRSTGTITKTEYSFVSNATMPLVNQVFGANNADSIKGVYFCLDQRLAKNADGTQKKDPVTGADVYELQIADRGGTLEVDPSRKLHEPILARNKLMTKNATDTASVFTFIYAYGTDIDTNP